jgi:hypothetical protein
VPLFLVGLSPRLIIAAFGERRKGSMCETGFDPWWRVPNP